MFPQSLQNKDQSDCCCRLACSCLHQAMRGKTVKPGNELEGLIHDKLPVLLGAPDASN